MASNESSMRNAVESCHTLDVIAGHSRPKDGVASLAYDPAIHLDRERDGSPGLAAPSRGGPVMTAE
jgi:hypothetical protein